MIELLLSLLPVAVVCVLFGVWVADVISMFKR